MILPIASLAARFGALLLLLGAPATTVAAGGLVNPFQPLLPSPHGIQANGQFGFAAVTAGDVNGDGFSDLLIGAPFEDNAKRDEGRLHLYLGSAEGLAASAARIYFTGQDSSYGAISVAPAGDVNGDGFVDYVMGVPWWNTANHVDAGKVLVYHGGSNLPYLPNAELFSPTPAASQLFGLEVSPAGDVDGDGFGDVIVDFHEFDRGGVLDAGKALVFHGAPNGLSPTPIPRCFRR